MRINRFELANASIINDDRIISVFISLMLLYLFVCRNILLFKIADEWTHQFKKSKHRITFLTFHVVVHRRNSHGG